MRKLLLLMVAVALLASVGSAQATIDWAGNVWPNHGASVVPTDPVAVYAQIYKGGVTDGAGQGADITAELFFTTDIATTVGVPMGYLGDVGNNDEYTAQVPQSALVGATWVDVTVIFTDLTDASQYEITGDQAGNPPPLRYSVVDVLPNDIQVAFTLCLSGEASAGDVCVTGSGATLTEWGSGVALTTADGQLYEGTVTFPAGSNPAFEYKYRKDGCASWEGVGNRTVALPTDGTTSVTLAPDSWNNAPIGCGLGDVLDADRIVCFQLCMADVGYTGGVCVIGSAAQIGNWSAGETMSHLGGELYQFCTIFPQGAPIPMTVEYKFQKDDCTTWESVGNRMLVIDNSSPADQVVTHSWDDGPGICQPVGASATTWSSLKELYR
ncbi:MAG: carbohydrate-binding module family 20 domain-containing protein [Candidatus Krumholzibacteriia bacterium]